MRAELILLFTANVAGCTKGPDVRMSGLDFTTTQELGVVRATGQVSNIGGRAAEVTVCVLALPPVEGENPCPCAEPVYTGILVAGASESFSGFTSIANLLGEPTHVACTVPINR